MCLDCIRRWKEDYALAYEQATEHMDAEGIPEDSLARGMVAVHLACNQNPMLATSMARCWPDAQALTG